MAGNNVEECGCGCGATEGVVVAETAASEQVALDQPQIIDYNVTMLIAAGAAMAANCEDCLNKIVPDLIEAGVGEADIRRAVEIGQFVKDKPAERMKEAADILTGSNLLKRTKSEEGCPADRMKQAASCG